MATRSRNGDLGLENLSTNALVGCRNVVMQAEDCVKKVAYELERRVLRA